MKKKIKVLVKEPGKKPRHIYISNTLENLQSHVGGYIETVTIAEDMVIICNEEGRLKGLPYNCRVLNIDFCGTIIFCGIDGENFSDLPADYQAMKSLFKNLWEE